VRRRRRQDINSVDVQQKTDDDAIQSASEKSQSMTSSHNMFQYSAEVIGMVETVYKFQSKYFTYLLKRFVFYWSIIAI